MLFVCHGRILQEDGGGWHGKYYAAIVLATPAEGHSGFILKRTRSGPLPGKLHKVAL